MTEEETLNLHLHKLSSKSNETTAIDHILETLWKTRKTGLGPHQKTYIQSLLNLPTPQELDPRSRVSCQVKVNAPLVTMPLLASEMSSSMWPRQDDATRSFNRNDLGSPMPIAADPNLPRMALVSHHRDDGPPDNLAILPRLKSMTWTMENRKSAPANRVAVITLKLQDFSKTPSGETEVKFQLSRDTLEAMLRSMAYISEQLSNAVALPTGPAQKKQRQ
ncbi:protein FAR1-RELATED SEQUENCE 3-like isoform X2 [Magnolia sinica]|uniref:protein FAR1-RELATED SEQUENCE 3-like isoform X2 n=1 Tax=Magnolia sinica TaxID=86752 RepID=UPI00265991B2|nr:protein FAR1-RELATED SEQUENCE 3-like isoform X2 [Magnolia sinica]